MDFSQTASFLSTRFYRFGESFGESENNKLSLKDQKDKKGKYENMKYDEVVKEIVKKYGVEEKKLAIDKLLYKEGLNYIEPNSVGRELLMGAKNIVNQPSNILPGKNNLPDWQTWGSLNNVELMFLKFIVQHHDPKGTILHSLDSYISQVPSNKKHILSNIAAHYTFLKDIPDIKKDANGKQLVWEKVIEEYLTKQEIYNDALAKATDELSKISGLPNMSERDDMIKRSTMAMAEKNMWKGLLNAFEQAQAARVLQEGGSSYSIKNPNEIKKSPMKNEKGAEQSQKVQNSKKTVKKSNDITNQNNKNTAKELDKSSKNKELISAQDIAKTEASTSPELFQKWNKQIDTLLTKLDIDFMPDLILGSEQELGVKKEKVFTKDNLRRVNFLTMLSIYTQNSNKLTAGKFNIYQPESGLPDNIQRSPYSQYEVMFTKEQVEKVKNYCNQLNNTDVSDYLVLEERLTVLRINTLKDTLKKQNNVNIKTSSIVPSLVNNINAWEARLKKVKQLQSIFAAKQVVNTRISPAS